MTGEITKVGLFFERWEWPTGEVQMAFHCPACESTHSFWLAQPGDKKEPIWHFNNDPLLPTFQPSLRIQDGRGNTCHLFVKNGMIEYCYDCTHDFASKTVLMKEF